MPTLKELERAPAEGGIGACIPVRKTVSDFICEFLKDRHLFNGNMPKDILAQSLNFPLNWLLGSDH